MNKKEVFEIIRNLRIKHGITLGEIEDIQQKETERLSSIEKIFDMSSQYDVDLLVALIYLLNEDPKPVYEWFKTNHKNCKYLSESRKPNPFGISKIIAGSRVAAITGNAFGGRIPLVGVVIGGGVGGLLGYMPNNPPTSKFKNDENYYNKLLIAAFIQNPLFFSMAWNWNIFNLNSIADSKSVLENTAPDLNTHFQNNNIILFKNRADLFHNQTIVLDYPIYASAAGTSGFNNITRIPIELLGELEIRGNSETEEIVFVLSINKEYQTLKFELTIDFEVNNSMYSATIEKNYSDEDDEVRSAPVQVDFSKGLKFQKINWKAL